MVAGEKDQSVYKADDHLRVVEQKLRLIEHLAHGPNSCDHELVKSYALQALTHLQVARDVLGVRTR